MTTCALDCHEAGRPENCRLLRQRARLRCIAAMHLAALADLSGSCGLLSTARWDYEAARRLFESSPKTASEQAAWVAEVLPLLEEAREAIYTAQEVTACPAWGAH